MDYVQLPTYVDLNDPERGFQFATEGDQVYLRFTDWKNRQVTFVFSGLYWFSYRRANTLHGLPEGEAVEILDSEKLRSIRKDGSASPEEVLHHYVISTNEGEWCEAVSASIDIMREN
ncbi:MAG: hypothetical protein MUF48_24295 [Pirellulaceae bacterium]|jgi:hypothetical protein|nr:hypothetical protein [Pirellulaceae bacterium]